MNCISETLIRNIVKQALKEDTGRRDITTDIIIPKTERIKANLLAKDDFVICGLAIAKAVFKEKDKGITFTSLIQEGKRVKEGMVLARIEGKAQSVLTTERVALNFLCFLSGIATKTMAYVNEVKPYRTKIVDTRKTIPGLRELEKYAVRMGGGYNHRMRLDEMILIKDNHLKVIKGYGALVHLLRDLHQRNFKDCPVEFEVKSLEEFKEALILNPDIIMLDNMSIKEMRKAVLVRNRFSLSPSDPMPKLEASGGITLENVRNVASTGVDMISIGALTHSVNSVDISLEFL